LIEAQSRRKLDVSSNIGTAVDPGFPLTQRSAGARIRDEDPPGESAVGPEVEAAMIWTPEQFARIRHADPNAVLLDVGAPEDSHRMNASAPPCSSMQQSATTGEHADEVEHSTMARAHLGVPVSRKYTVGEIVRGSLELLIAVAVLVGPLLAPHLMMLPLMAVGGFILGFMLIWAPNCSKPGSVPTPGGR
jgi:hypothetical protein